MLCGYIEGVVDILLDGGAVTSVSVRNRKNLLPSQLTHNMNILNKLSAAERHHHHHHHLSDAAAAAAKTSAVSPLCSYS